MKIRGYLCLSMVKDKELHDKILFEHGIKALRQAQCKIALEF